MINPRRAEVLMQPSPEILRAILAKDTPPIKKLADLLTPDRTYLQPRQHNKLPDRTEAKDQLLAQLGARSQQRQQWLVQANLSRDQHGWVEFLHRQADTRALIEPWQELTERFSECQKLNEINGKIIGRSRQTLGQLLNILRGQASGPQLYNADGATAPQSDSQSLVKA